MWRRHYVKLGAGAFMTIVFLLIVIFAGWVMNIMDLVHMTAPLQSGEGIVRLIGIFAFPIGSFMGIFY